MSANYLQRLREKSDLETPRAGTDKTDKTTFVSFVSAGLEGIRSIFSISPTGAANDTGPRLDDLNPAGREAGWRIYRALLAPGPAVEPVARPSPAATADATPHYRWILHFPDHDPVEAGFSPEATHAEVLALHPDAVAAEPVERPTRQPE